MNKVLYAFLSVMCLTSCVNSYNIQGSSNVSTLDGRMLYLKVLKNKMFLFSLSNGEPGVKMENAAARKKTDVNLKEK